MKGSVDVIIEDIKKHPSCPHGPTLLFSRKINNTDRKYFACSACRDRKQCNFFLWEDEKSKLNKELWMLETKNFIRNVKHRKMFMKLNELLAKSDIERSFCQNCNILCKSDDKQHVEHNVIKRLTDFQLKHPSEFLPTLDNSKKEAQFHFSQLSVKIIVNIVKDLGYKNVICLGTPRIHEYIQNNCDHMTSVLLDIDKRFHNFFGPLQYCWYNMFNNHFFFKEAQNVFRTYLQSDGGNKMILITDPPFGGRTEILSATFKSINEEYTTLNNKKTNLAIFWIYPYFMEPQILNSLPDFFMLDYKIDYDNHQSFQNSSTGRKLGSPVRIFTNIKPSLIKLPSPDYKYCQICDRWVANENKHCKLCNSCTSKNGDTYVHCAICNRCVKPTWKHCETCGRCAQVIHSCAKIQFVKECFNCQEFGHKRVDCPLLKKAKVKKRKIIQNSEIFKYKRKKKRKN